MSTAADALREAADAYLAEHASGVEAALSALDGEPNLGQRYDILATRWRAEAVAAWLRKRAEHLEQQDTTTAKTWADWMAQLPPAHDGESLPDYWRRLGTPPA